MMQATKPWRRHNLAACVMTLRHFSARRSLLAQTKVGSVLVVVTDVLIHEALQMPLIENDHVVEQIAAAVTNPALGDAVLPGATKVGSFRLDAEAPDSIDDFFIEIAATVEDQVARRGVVRECLAQLLNNPCAGRMPGSVKMQNPPPVMRDDEETVKHAEGERLHSKEIHCGDSFPMIAEKRRPSLCALRIPRSFSHPAQHRTLRDVEAQHSEFTMDPRRSPGSVLVHYAEDELAQFPAQSFSSRMRGMTGKPGPVELEASLMPANHCLRFNEDQSSLPSRPEAPERDPKESIGTRKSLPWAMTHEN